MVSSDLTKIYFLPSVGMEVSKHRLNRFPEEYSYNFYTLESGGLKILYQLHQLK